jgi:hypothetical protein
MGKSFHMTIDVGAFLLKSDADLNELVFDDDHRYIPAQELRRLLNAARAKGYSVLPMCDHIDEDGMCLGHPTGA